MTIHPILFTFLGALVWSAGGISTLVAADGTNGAVAKDSPFSPTIPNTAPAPANAPDGMVWVPGGEFSMGSLAPDTGVCTMATKQAVQDTYARLKLEGGVPRNPQGPGSSYNPASDQPQRVHRGGSFLCPGHPDSIVTDWSVDPDDWGYFLCKVFDQWHRNDLCKVLVNHFETLVAQHMGQGSQLCIYSEFCGKGVAVENDGGVYSCDHYVYPEYRLGNIMDASLDAQVFSRTQVKFGYAKNETLPKYCRQCPYLTDCWGECPKNRVIRTADGEPGLNYLCRGFKHYFAHAIPAVDRIAADLRKRPFSPRQRM
jgi:radical SAM protein with 4Fe4S-binding SPASM domain